jgi:predicted O-methyltransferase YrrM
MPEPYQSIAVLPFDGQGWFGNGNQLENVIANRDIQTVIEVGSWLGCSTRFFAERFSKVYAIDTWRGSPAEDVHMQDPRLPFLYQQFLSNIIHSNMTDVIIPCRMESLEAARALNVTADLIYIDACHETVPVCNDILAWYPHLNEGGIMCGDDWLWPSVRKGVITAAQLLNRSIYSEDNFWCFE